MTATNHAVTGALIATIIPNPTTAVLLAFVSHFVLDAIPHYNPPGATKKTFSNFTEIWDRKFSNKNFKAIFFIDMFLLATALILLPLTAAYQVSPLLIFICSIAAISPDFIGGRFLIYKIIGLKTHSTKSKNLFNRFHIWVQWMERPWGLWVELLWLVCVVVLIFKVS